MRYLFFDIECSDGFNICEFGYAITDTNFNIIESDNIIINPNAKFELGEFKLAYSEDIYNNSNKFNYYYKKIKELIEYKDQIIFGFAISNDANFLNIASKKYNLEAINFNFIDIQRIYSHISNISRQVSLEEASSNLELEVPINLHRADIDTLLTINLLIAILKKQNITINELITNSEYAKGVNNNFEIYYIYDKLKNIESYNLALSGASNIMDSNNNKLFYYFVNNVEPNNYIIKSKFNNKKICVSLNYEYNHFKEMISLVQILANHNCTYTLKATECDIFISYGGKYCRREKHVRNAIKDGNNIEIMKFKHFLILLNTTEELLLKAEFPKYKYFEKKPIKKNVIINNEEVFNTNVGEMFKEFFKEYKG